MKFYVASGGVWRAISGTTPTTSVPSAPSSVGMSAGDAQATVTWVAPDNTGGLPITSYTVKCIPTQSQYATQTVTVDASILTETFTGLTNGVTYYATVAATNSKGTGPAAQSSQVTPLAPSTGSTRMDATNTGVLGYYDTSLGRNLQYSDLTPNSTTTFTTPNVTYTKQDFTGQLHIAADNVKFVACRVTIPSTATGTDYPIKWSTPAGAASGTAPVGFSMSYCEINGGGVDGTSGTISGWAPSATLYIKWGYSLDHCNVYGTSDAFKPQDNPAGTSISITNCYVHDLPIVNPGTSSVSHNDFFQIAGSGAHDVTIQGNTLDAYRPTAPSAIINGGGTQWGSFAANSTIQNIDISNNYVNGVNIAWRMAFATSDIAVCQNVRIHDNRVGLHVNAGKSSSGTGQDGGTISFTNNVWDVSGTTDGGQSVLAGQVIP